MKKILLVYLAGLLCLPVTSKAQETEFKDTPYFSGMPNYFIYDAKDIEFDSYNFYNGKDCPTVEGKKFVINFFGFFSPSGRLYT